jgi:hypothetical protein
MDKSDKNCISPKLAVEYRAKTPQQRLWIAFDMWRSVQNIVSVAVRRRNPEWTPHMCQVEVAARMSSIETLLHGGNSDEWACILDAANQPDGIKKHE